MRRDWRTGLAVLAVFVVGAAVLVVVVFQLDSNTEGVGDAKGTAKDAKRGVVKNTVSIKDLKAIDRRVSANTRGIARKANRNEVRGVRTQRSLTTLNRVVLGSPGASGVPGRSIEGRRGITGLTTTGLQGGNGVDGTNGTNGTNGVDGSDAPPAVNGTDGEDGDQGPKGDTGDTGSQGPQGPSPTTGTCDLTPDPSDSPTAMACTFP